MVNIQAAFRKGSEVDFGRGGERLPCRWLLCSLGKYFFSAAQPSADPSSRKTGIVAGSPGHFRRRAQRCSPRRLEAVEREESVGDDAAAFGHTATGFLLGEGMLLCFVGLGQGCLTCLGTAVGFIRVGGCWFRDRARIGGRGKNDRSFHRFKLKQSGRVLCAQSVDYPPKIDAP